MTSFVFWVPGVPKPQGSKTYINKRFAKESSAGLPAWRSDIFNAAEKALAVYMEDGEDLRPLWDAPLLAMCTFFFARPKSHFRTGKNSHLLKDDAPEYPMSKNLGDVEKLARAVFDPLTNLIYEDDKNIVDAELSKRYTGYNQPTPGVEVGLRSIPLGVDKGPPSA